MTIAETYHLAAHRYAQALMRLSGAVVKAAAAESVPELTRRSIADERIARAELVEATANERAAFNPYVEARQAWVAEMARLAKEGG